MSIDDRKFIDIITRNIEQRSDGHYEMPLPLKSREVRLPNNKGLAIKRLSQLKRRFQRCSSYYNDYKIFMKDVILECAEEATDDIGSEPIAMVNYVPHTGVYHPKKPGKIRVVFDCSAEYQGTSLNKKRMWP
uniref:uncharacterized protein LOC104265820 n=1 Tax=Ciona intestinalis TaxID=7719 RepID=UPI000EF4FE33|nr:uncharacterized protein LOC104265820 [Ciona intestinalis]|eukprot:XP_026695432.1 uncharacterized protein LOC104265820 [Ciona intestinalis]